MKQTNYNSTINFIVQEKKIIANEFLPSWQAKYSYRCGDTEPMVLENHPGSISKINQQWSQHIYHMMQVLPPWMWDWEWCLFCFDNLSYPTLAGTIYLHFNPMLFLWCFACCPAYLLTSLPWKQLGLRTCECLQTGWYNWWKYWMNDIMCTYWLLTLSVLYSLSLNHTSISCGMDIICFKINERLQFYLLPEKVINLLIETIFLKMVYTERFHWEPHLGVRFKDKLNLCKRPYVFTATRINYS